MIRAVKKALKFIREEQEPDGSWFGRWGVNYIYGTMQVLRGLEAMGVDHHEPYIQQGAEWLRMVQNSDGGWGETCGSYDDPNTTRSGSEHAFADSLGGDGAAGGQRYAQRFAWRAALLICLRTQKEERCRGMSRRTPVPVSRGCFI